MFVFDFANGQERKLTNGADSDIEPRFSPDGRSVAFLRDAKELHLYDLAANTDRVVATGRFDYPPLFSEQLFSFSPDGKWIAYLSGGLRGFVNASVVPFAGGESREVSFTSNSNGGYLRWSPDGKYLLQGSSQRTENGQVIRVDSQAACVTPFREDQFRELFPGDPRPARTDSAPPAAAPARDSAAAPAPRRGGAPPTEIVFDGIRERSSAIPLDVDVGSAAIKLDGNAVDRGRIGGSAEPAVDPVARRERDGAARAPPDHDDVRGFKEHQFSPTTDARLGTPRNGRGQRSKSRP